jgi:Holliday junction DNA helicase RuvA
MIGKLTGTLDGAALEGAVILEAGGVGYSVRVPLTTLQDLRSKKEKSVSLYIYTAVREDAIELYGFKTREELQFFKELMGVKGVGPKTALSILNVADVKTLTRSIAAGDASVLTKVFGIGKKSAERIVVELRDKLAHRVGEGNDMERGGDDVEVLEALIALGYSVQESRQALRGVARGVSGVHNRLSMALKNLGGHTS